MLNKNQSNKRNSWKYAAVLPLLGAFLFFFQVKVVAQEKESVKQETEAKKAVDLTTFKIEKDLNTLSKGKEIYVDGKKITEEELAKINPNVIKTIDVIKKSDKSVIVVATKNASTILAKPVKITDKDIFIDGVKVTNEDFLKLDQSTVDKVDVNTYENTVRITTKTINQSSNNFDIPVPPTPPTPPAFTFKNPKPPVFPKAPKAPKGDPIKGDKKAWKEFESKMEDFNKKIKSMEPQMKAFEKQMEEFNKQMEPFNASMETYDKKMKIYEQQMQEYETKIESENRKKLFQLIPQDKVSP